MHDAMVERYAAGDRLEYFKLNQQIHSAFLRLSGNAALASAHAAIQSCLKRIRYIGNQEPRQVGRRDGRARRDDPRARGARRRGARPRGEPAHGKHVGARAAYAMTLPPPL